MKNNLSATLNSHVIKPTTGRRKVTYGHTGRRWVFQVGSYVLITAAPGGRPTADRIADILSKGVVLNKESKQDAITGSARTAISKMTAIKGLKAGFIPEYIQDPNEAQRLADNVAHPETRIVIVPPVEVEAETIPVVVVSVPAETDLVMA